MVVAGSIPLSMARGSADPLGAAGHRRILLVCPPFQFPHLASLATAHLGTLVRERGGACAEAYPHFELANLLGPEKYLEVGGGTHLAGELLFAEGLHGEPREEAIAAMLSDAFGSADAREELRREFTRRAFAATDYTGFDLIGFTTSFNQLMAALYLGHAVKQLSPEVKLVLGGAACATPMGAAILAAYPEVDFVVSGWGEAPLLALSRGEVSARQLLECHGPLDLDALPIPDYAPFLAVAGVAWAEQPLALAFESSRGCWWGQKHHCRFCGVNGPTLAYHAKSSGRVLSEIRTLWDRHRTNLRSNDAVLSRQHLEEVIPALGRFDEGPMLFYELRSNVTAEQVAALARARVQGQPGLESLSTRLLELLGKGLTAIQNLAFLKWAAEQRVSLAWNLLYGIPGELLVDYERQLALIELIPQLPPPERINPIHLVRHSPYFEDSATHGWREVEPLLEYRGMHPHLEAGDLARIAKYFSGRSPVDTAPYQDRLEQAVTRWRERHAAGQGLYLDPERGLVRNEVTQGKHFASSPAFDAVLEHTNEITSLPELQRATRTPRALLTAMEAAGILFVERDRVLNLAVRTRPIASRAG